jgi:hypothetical protein
MTGAVSAITKTTFAPGQLEPAWHLLRLSQPQRRHDETLAGRLLCTSAPRAIVRPTLLAALASLPSIPRRRSVGRGYVKEWPKSETSDFGGGGIKGGVARTSQRAACHRLFGTRQCTFFSASETAPSRQSPAMLVSP